MNIKQEGNAIDSDAEPAAVERKVPSDPSDVIKACQVLRIYHEMMVKHLTDNPSTEHGTDLGIGLHQDGVALMEYFEKIELSLDAPSVIADKSGCVLVPAEPTPTMLAAVPMWAASDDSTAREVWKCMLAASPAPPAVERKVPMAEQLQDWFNWLSRPTHNPMETGFRHSPLTLREERDRAFQTCAQVAGEIQHFLASSPAPPAEPASGGLEPFDLQAVAWAYGKLLLYGAQNSGAETAQWMDRLSAVLASEPVRGAVK